MTRILDPTLQDAPAPDTAPRAPRPVLAGATIGLLANGKSNAMALLDRLAEHLCRHHGVAGVVRAAKVNASAPAPPKVADRLAAGCAAVVTAIGD